MGVTIKATDVSAGSPILADREMGIDISDDTLYYGKSGVNTALGGGGGGQPLDATLTAFAALTIAANSLTVGTGADAFSQTSFAASTFPARASTGDLVAKTITDFALTILDDADAATVRATIGAGTGNGTVSSVALSVPSILSVSGSPVTTSGTLAVSLATQSANTIFAGPTSGSAATPTVRSMVVADLPALNGFTDEPSVAADDRLPFYDTSATANRDCAVSDVMLRALPVGACIDWPAATVPTGFLERDGSAVSRSTYSALFSVLSTTWGSGDGSTTFNLPDDRGRTAIGVGTGTTLTARNLGTSSGTENHTLSTAELPSHTHQPSGDAVLRYTGSAGSYSLPAAGTDVVLNITIPNTGSGTAHNNMQPWVAYKKIIKALAAT